MSKIYYCLNFIVFTYVLFAIAACIEGWWTYLTEISFAQYLMMPFSALSQHLMVTFTYARHVERN